MTLRAQFILGAGILIAVLLAMAAFAITSGFQLAGLRSQEDIAAAVQRKANDLSYVSNNYVLYQEPAQKSQWDSLFASFLSEVDRLEPSGPEESALIDSIKANSNRLKQVFTDIASGIAASAASAPVGDRAFLQLSWSRLEVQNRQIIFGASQLEQTLDQKIDRANLISTIVIFGIVGVVGLLLLAGYFFVYRRAISGISALRAGTEVVGSGDLDYRILDDRNDEIGDLSRAFNKMTSDLKTVTASKSHLEREVAERKRAEAARERLLLKEKELGLQLAASNEELHAQNEELATREDELAAQNEELRAAREEATGLLEERSALIQQLQTALLHIPQELPGVRFGHLYGSATKEAQVGGDFYDVFETKNHEVGLLIGDVSGHGVEAARIATLVKDTVHAFAHQFRRPHLVLRETNRLLVEKKLPGFVSTFLGFLDPKSGRLVFSSAGHPPPLLAAGGTSVFLESTGSPLGVFPNARYHDSEMLMVTGSVLLLYTDGITEARSGDVLFGEEGLRRSLARASGLDVESLPGVLLSDALRFSGEDLQDDVALLAVSYLGAPVNGSAS